MKNNILYVAIAILFIILFCYLLRIGLDKNEQIECRKWKAQEANYPLFYTLQWQKDQCNQYNIEFSR